MCNIARRKHLDGFTCVKMIDNLKKGITRQMQPKSFVSTKVLFHKLEKPFKPHVSLIDDDWKEKQHQWMTDILSLGETRSIPISGQHCSATAYGNNTSVAVYCNQITSCGLFVQLLHYCISLTVAHWQHYLDWHKEHKDQISNK